jgi:formylglycine-generating enzyme
LIVLLARMSCLLSLLIASSASAVPIDWVPVGDPGNQGDPQQSCFQCGPETTFGSVPYAYQVSKYEVTYAQYTEFLNAKASSDPLNLYEPSMGNVSLRGGITRSGVDGSYTYSVIPGRADFPVGYVTFYDAIRFANWMNNGQGSGDTETGAYTLLGSAETPTNQAAIARTPSAKIALTSENEWYKAAYYDPATASYFDFPTRSNTATACGAATSAPNSANCFHGASSDMTSVGSYTGSASPYGTYDQGGNMVEWVETNSAARGRTDRGNRGGSWIAGSFALEGSFREFSDPRAASDSLGYRLVMIPEPSTGLLVLAGLLGLGIRRRVSL